MRISVKSISAVDRFFAYAVDSSGDVWIVRRRNPTEQFQWFRLANQPNTPDVPGAGDASYND